MGYFHWAALVSGSETWGEWVGGTVAEILILPLASFATALGYGLLSRYSSDS